MAGVIGVAPPWWAPIMGASDKWGIPPWVVEAECSQEWWGRYLTYREAETQARQWPTANST